MARLPMRWEIYHGCMGFIVLKDFPSLGFAVVFDESLQPWYNYYITSLYQEIAAVPISADKPDIK